MNDELSRDEVEAALGVRREMGAEIEPALVDSLAAKIEATVERRFQAQAGLERHQAAAGQVGQNGRIAVGIVSLAMAIPLTAIAGGIAGFFGMLLVWTGIVLVNMALAMKRPGS